MIEPVKQNLSIRQGTTYDKRWRWTSEGSPVDLTGANIMAQARPAAQADLIYLDMNEDSGQIVIYDAIDGIFGILLTAAQTSALTFASAVYDLEIHWANGVVDRIFYGTIKLDREVTR